MYKIMVDYRPTNEAAINDTSPMTHIDAALQEVRGAQSLATLI